MIVYHGTDNLSAENIKNNGIDIKYGDESVDNGMGFYMTPSYILAENRAKYAANKKAEFYNESVTPAVIKFEIDLENASKLSVKEFDDCSYDWKEFIFYNRIGEKFIKKWNIKTDNHNLDFKYDIVMDETADNKINTIISDLRYKRNVTEEIIKTEIEKIKKSNEEYWDRQISIHTKSACAFTKFIDIINIHE